MRFLFGAMLSLLIGFTASAESAFEPAFAADQPNMTSEGMNKEALEFQSLHDYSVALVQAAESGAKARVSEKMAERGRQLVKIQQISETAEAGLELKALQDQKDQARHLAEADEALAKAGAAKCELLERGNPGKSWEREMIQWRMKMEQAKIRGLQASLDYTQEEQRQMATYTDHGKSLNKKDIVPDSEVESRQELLETSAARAQGLKSEIETANSYLHALERALQRMPQS